MNTTTKFLLQSNTNLLLRYLATLDTAEKQVEIKHITKDHRFEDLCLRDVLFGSYMLGQLSLKDKKERFSEFFEDSFFVSDDDFESMLKLSSILHTKTQKALLNKALKVLISKGCLNRAKAITLRLNRHLTKKEIKELLNSVIKKGYFTSAKEIVAELDRELSQDELIDLLKVLKEQDGSFPIETSIEVANVLGKGRAKWLKIALDRCIENGLSEVARKVAKLLRRPLKNEELEGLVASNVKHARVSHAKGDVADCGRDFTKAEIIHMISVKIDICSFITATELVQELPKSLQSEYIVKILCEAIDYGRFEDIFTISDLYKKPLPKKVLKDLLARAGLRRDLAGVSMILDLLDTQYFNSDKKRVA